MQNYKIISDSSCDLPYEYIKKFDIDLVPYFVSFDGINYYKENVDITTSEFYNKITVEKLFPKTSLPPIQDYIDIFEKYLSQGQDIICFTLTSKFSGSYQSAVNAKNILTETYPERKIKIIDTIQATGGQGLVVYQACLMKQSQQYTIEQLSEKINILKKTAKINFFVESLEYLKRGGRIGKASALAGSLLNIKPIITVTNGELIPCSKVRGQKKAVQEIIKMTLNEIGQEKEKYDFLIIHSCKENEAENLENLIKNEYNITTLKPIVNVGVTIGTHAGPYVMGLCYIKKYTEI